MYTSLTHMIVPIRFAQYVKDRQTEWNKIMYSGAVEENPLLSNYITAGGSLLHMPSYSNISGTAEVLAEGTALTVNNISAKDQLVPSLIRGKAWGATELAGAMAGTDPLQAIQEYSAEWIIRDEKRIILSVLKGAFAAATMSGLVMDITAATDPSLGVNTFLDACQLIGDNADRLSLVWMHSAVYNSLMKKNQIAFIVPSESKVSVATYLGRRIVVDDACPVDTTGTDPVYTTYILSNGFIQRGQGAPQTLTEVEVGRERLKSEEYIIYRYAKAIAPRGVSFTGSAAIAGSTPSNAELETGTNWTRVADTKIVGAVAVKHKV